jgi:hypothetical protein
LGYLLVDASDVLSDSNDSNCLSILLHHCPAYNNSRLPNNVHKELQSKTIRGCHGLSVPETLSKVDGSHTGYAVNPAQEIPTSCISQPEKKLSKHGIKLDCRGSSYIQALSKVLRELFDSESPIADPEWELVARLDPSQ